MGHKRRDALVDVALRHRARHFGIYYILREGSIKFSAKLRRTILYFGQFRSEPFDSREPGEASRVLRTFGFVSDVALSNSVLSSWRRLGHKKSWSRDIDRTT